MKHRSRYVASLAFAEEDLLSLNALLWKPRDSRATGGHMEEGMDGGREDIGRAEWTEVGRTE